MFEFLCHRCSVACVLPPTTHPDPTPPAVAHHLPLHAHSQKNKQTTPPPGCCCGWCCWTAGGASGRLPVACCHCSPLQQSMLRAASRPCACPCSWSAAALLWGACCAARSSSAALVCGGACMRPSGACAPWRQPAGAPAPAWHQGRPVPPRRAQQLLLLQGAVPAAAARRLHQRRW